MPSTQAAPVKKIRTAHEVIADSCRSIPQNPPSESTQALPKAEGSAPGLSPQQNLAIGHLVAGRSYSETARLVNVDRSTLYEWRKQPAFVARLDELSREALEAVGMRTRNLLLRGTERLERAMDGMMMFGDVLRIVSNKRIWDMAHVMPREDSGEADCAEDGTKRGVKEKGDDRE